MYINHDLKSDFLEYLSNATFIRDEFKQVRKKFIKSFPIYKDKRFYPKIYKALRELCEEGVVQMDDSTCTYKYSSYPAFANRKKDNSIRNQDYVMKELMDRKKEIDEEIVKIKVELDIYSTYLKLYPEYSENIVCCLEKRRLDLFHLESEQNVLSSLYGSLILR